MGKVNLWKASRLTLVLATSVFPCVGKLWKYSFL